MNWYYAHLRWAVMVEGVEGLRRWEEAMHIFLSGDPDQAFTRALKIGYEHESEHQEGRRWVQTRLAEVLMLQSMGPDAKEFSVEMACKKPPERLPFEHVFDPAGTVPAPIF